MTMTMPVRIGGTETRRVRACLALACAFAAAVTPVAAQDGGADAAGLQPLRSYASPTPFEHVDTLMGGLVIQHTDLVLPGDGGHDLAFVRTFSSRRPLWVMGLAGLPLFMTDPTWAGTDSSTPASYLNAGASATVGLSDGSDKILLGPPAPCVVRADCRMLQSVDFWRYDRDLRRLDRPDGVTLFYDAPLTSNGSLVQLLRTVRDASEHTILEFEWTAQAVTIRQYVNPAARTIVLHFDDLPYQILDITPTSLEYGGHTWTYTPTSATLPNGLVWQYGIANSQLVSVTTPQGGVVSYTWGPHTFLRTPGAPAVPVLQARTVAAQAGLVGGTWTYAYDAPVQDATTITAQGDDVAVQYHYAFTDIAHGQQPQLVRRVVLDHGAEVTREVHTWVELPVSVRDSFAYGPDTVTVQRDGLAYETRYAYTVGTLFADFHHPSRIIETGPTGVQRTTDLVYEHAPVDFDIAYILTALTRETVTVGGESVSRAFWHDHETGFLENAFDYAGVETAFEQDEHENLASSTNGNGHTTLFEHTWGNVSRILPPRTDREIRRDIYEDGWVHDEVHHTTEDVTLTYHYDPIGQIQLIDPDGLTKTDIVYSTPTTVIATQGGMATTTTLDGFGRPIRIASNQGTTVDLAYDREGRLIRDGHAYGGGDNADEAADFLTYDALGRITRREHGLSTGDAITYAYTGDDVTITDENGHVTVQQWQAFGHPESKRLAALIDAKGKTWQYAYDVLGNLTGVTDPSGTLVRTWEYVNGQLKKETHPESGQTTYTYDDAGNLKTATNANGEITTFVYDENERLIRTEVGTRTTTLAYENGTDNPAVITALADGVVDVVTRLQYDRGGRIIERRDELDGRTFTSTFGYDTPGSDAVTRVTYPSGRTIVYGLDAAGQVLTVSEPAAGGGAGVTYAQGFTYDSLGSVEDYTTANGIVHETRYDERRRWVENIHAGDLDLRYDFTGDQVGNVQTLTDTRAGAPAQVQSFGYDTLDRLTSATGPYGSVLYAYDDHGNRQSTAGATYTYFPGTFRLQHLNAQGFVYDNVGHIKQTTSPDATYRYTPDGLMDQATIAGVVTGYRYTGDGWRVRKATGGLVSYHLRGPGGDLLTEVTDATGSPVLTDYIYAAGRLIAVVRKTF